MKPKKDMVIKMQKVLSLLRCAVDTYKMIQPGDRIAVGVSGGKDSMLMLAGLAALRRFNPASFELVAITLDMRFNGTDTDLSAIEAFCEKLGVPCRIRRTDIGPVIFGDRREDNPCSLCARMRRGVLHDEAKAAGCNKLALGHHRDDAVETFFLNLFEEGRLGCFSPVTYLSRKDLTMIRPLCLLSEAEVVDAVNRLEIPVVKSLCPADKHTQRQDVKELLESLETEYPGLRTKVVGAMQRGALSGWEPLQNARKKPKNEEKEDEEC